MPNTIHVGDIGTSFVVQILDENDAAIPLDSATTHNFRVRKPDGTYVVWAASVTDAPNGELTYIVVSGDLDMPGRWRLEVELVYPGWDGTTTVGEFLVYEVL